MVRVPTARILVIDDDPEVVDILVTTLRDEGYGVLGALTSDEGLKLVILSRPDLVLLDIMLPGMNGIEVLKRIRSINPTAAATPTRRRKRPFTPSSRPWAAIPTLPGKHRSMC